MRDIKATITLEIEGIEDCTGAQVWFKNHPNLVVNGKTREAVMARLNEMTELALVSYIEE